MANKINTPVFQYSMIGYSVIQRKTRQGKARQGRAWHGMARYSRVLQDRVKHVNVPMNWKVSAELALTRSVAKRIFLIRPPCDVPNAVRTTRATQPLIK